MSNPLWQTFGLKQRQKFWTLWSLKAGPNDKTAESPVSLRTIGVNEIKRNPGANRDISLVIQSLPGVASTASFRNDILIRGGAPSENRFYLDGRDPEHQPLCHPGVLPADLLE